MLYGCIKKSAFRSLAVFNFPRLIRPLSIIAGLPPGTEKERTEGNSPHLLALLNFQADQDTVCKLLLIILHGKESRLNRILSLINARTGPPVKHGVFF